MAGQTVSFGQILIKFAKMLKQERRNWKLDRN